MTVKLKYQLSGEHAEAARASEISALRFRNKHEALLK
jgi:hypothetical protein